VPKQASTAHLRVQENLSTGYLWAARSERFDDWRARKDQNPHWLLSVLIKLIVRKEEALLLQAKNLNVF
jgi:hypothetical protein